MSGSRKIKVKLYISEAAKFPEGTQPDEHNTVFITDNSEGNSLTENLSVDQLREIVEDMLESKGYELVGCGFSEDIRLLAFNYGKVLKGNSKRKLSTNGLVILENSSDAIRNILEAMDARPVTVRNADIEPPTFIYNYEKLNILVKKKPRNGDIWYPTSYVVNACLERNFDKVDYMYGQAEAARWILNDYDPCTHIDAVTCVSVVCLAQKVGQQRGRAPSAANATSAHGKKRAASGTQGSGASSAKRAAQPLVSHTSTRSHSSTQGSIEDSQGGGAEAVPAAQKLKIVLRPPVLGHDTKSGIIYKSPVNAIRDLDCSSTTGLVALRSKIVSNAREKNLDCDFTLGKLFYAPRSDQDTMRELSSGHQLAELVGKFLKAHKPLPLAIGGAHADAVDDEDEYAVSNSQGYLKLKDPPLRAEGQTSKQAAQGNRDKVEKAMAYVNSMYHDIDSPWYHAFTRYHQGALRDYFQTHPERILAAGKYPPLEDWDKLSPDGSWDYTHHEDRTMGYCMKPGAYPPGKDGRPPMASIPLYKRVVEGLESGSASSSAGTGEDGVGNAINAAMAVSNQNAYLSNLIKLQEQKVAQMNTPTAASAADPTAVRRAQLQVVLKETMESLHAYRADNSAPDADVVNNFEAKIRRCQTNIDKIDDALFDAI